MTMVMGFVMLMIVKSILFWTVFCNFSVTYNSYLSDKNDTKIFRILVLTECSYIESNGKTSFVEA